MAEAAYTEGSRTNIPMIHFSGVSARALTERGFVDAGFSRRYIDAQGVERYEHMIISADQFTQQAQARLAHKIPGDQEALDQILFTELGTNANNRGPTENIRAGLMRYEGSIAHAINGLSIDPNDLANLRNSVRDRLSILQGLIFYEKVAITPLPDRIAGYIINKHEIQTLNNRLSDLDQKASKYLPAAQAPTIRPLIEQRSISLNPADRAAVKDPNAGYFRD